MWPKLSGATKHHVAKAEWGDGSPLLEPMDSETRVGQWSAKWSEPSGAMDLHNRSLWIRKAELDDGLLCGTPLDLVLNS